MSRIGHFPKLVLSIGLMTIGTGCSVAPLVQDAGTVGPSVLASLPDATPITTMTSDGVHLRGVHVPVRDPAAVVLHLLPSGTSVQTGAPIGIGRVGLTASLDALKRLGFTSVAFDYRGVGDSDGPRNTEHLISDGKAMWLEAVRLAGGRPDRVIIRAGSLGTLIVVALLADGIQPAGVVLFAPVRSSTIVHHATASKFGRLWASISTGLYRPVKAPDIEDVVSHTPVPTLVVIPTNDEFLPADEAALVASALMAGGHALIEYSGDHHSTILRSWNFELDTDGHAGRHVLNLMNAELAFLRRHVAPSHGDEITD